MTIDYKLRQETQFCTISTEGDLELILEFIGRIYYAGGCTDEEILHDYMARSGMNFVKVNNGLHYIKYNPFFGWACKKWVLPGREDNLMIGIDVPLEDGFHGILRGMFAHIRGETLNYEYYVYPGRFSCSVGLYAREGRFPQVYYKLLKETMQRDDL